MSSSRVRLVRTRSLPLTASTSVIASLLLITRLSSTLLELHAVA
jgi:hypothetical protein